MQMEALIEDAEKSGVSCKSLDQKLLSEHEPNVQTVESSRITASLAVNSTLYPPVKEDGATFENPETDVTVSWVRFHFFSPCNLSNFFLSSSSFVLKTIAGKT